jgi:HEAT repeat protein
MKNLKIHLLWFLVALISVAGLSRIFAAKAEGDFREREKALKNEIRELKQRLAGSQGTYEEEAMAAALAQPSSTQRAEVAKGSRPAEGEGRQERPEKQEKVRKQITPDDIRALLKSSNRNNRRRALAEIKKLKDKALQMTLLREAIQNGDNDMKYRAILMFDEIGKPEGTILAMEILRSGESDWVRARAARELSQLKDPGTYDALMSAFREDNGYLKYWSAKALQAMGWEGPVGELVSAASTRMGDPDGAIRERIIEQIGDLGSSAALPYLDQALSDPNSRVRREAVQAMGNLGTSALPMLRRSLNDPMRRVREEAVDSLRDIGGQEAIAILQVALNDKDSSIVRRAQQAIERLQRSR